MSAPFGFAVDTLFANEHVARDATYTPQGGQGIAVRVVPKRPDQALDVLGQEVVTGAAVFDVRVSEVAAPQAGDTIALDGATYVVQGEPRWDALRLVWTLEAREQ